MFKKLLFTAAVLAAASAQAVTITATPGAPDKGPAAGSVLIDNFNNATTQPAGVTLTGGYGFRTGTVGTVGAEPAGDTTQYLYVSSAINPNNATITFGNFKQVSFYWGSIDKFNTVDVLGANGTSIFTLNGGQVPPADGNQSIPSTNQRVSFNAASNETITGLKFTSTGIAFELDDLYGVAGSGSGSVVPEPSSWAMLIAGFGLVGFASRRRRGSASVAA